MNLANDGINSGDFYNDDNVEILIPNPAPAELDFIEENEIDKEVARESVEILTVPSILAAGVAGCTSTASASLRDLDEFLPDDLTPTPLNTLFQVNNRMSGMSEYALTPHKTKHGDLAKVGGVVHVDVADLAERGITELNINNKRKEDFINCCGRKIPKKTGKFVTMALGGLIAITFFIVRAIERKSSFTDVGYELLVALLLFITPTPLEGIFR